MSQSPRLLSDYTLPPVPYVLGLLAEGQRERIEAYGHACAEHVRGPLVEENARLVTRIAESDGALVEANKLLSELCTEVEKLRADAERLEWLAARFACNPHTGMGDLWYLPPCNLVGRDVRAAIDAARKGEGSEG